VRRERVKIKTTSPNFWQYFYQKSYQHRTFESGIRNYELEISIFNFLMGQMYEKDLFVVTKRKKLDAVALIALLKAFACFFLIITFATSNL